MTKSILKTNQITEFTNTFIELYKLYFSKFSLLKPLIVSSILYSSDNYGLVVKTEDGKEHSFSLYGSQDGILIKEGLEENINVYFSVKISFIENIIKNKKKYKEKPYLLTKFIPLYFTSMAVVDKKLFTMSIKGEKIELRQGEQKDIPYMLVWYNNHELNRLAGWSDSFVGESKLLYNISKGFGDDPMNLIIDNEEGTPIGTIQLYDISGRNKSCFLGVRIGDFNYMGKGYGVDAIHTLLEYAFTRMDIQRVALRVYEYNERAFKCYIKCGFKIEGRTRKSVYVDGKFYDEIMMSILKSDFFNLNPID